MKRFSREKNTAIKAKTPQYKRGSKLQRNRQRPYHVEHTGSRPITEVKHRRAWSALGWVYRENRPERGGVIKSKHGDKRYQRSTEVVLKNPVDTHPSTDHDRSLTPVRNKIKMYRDSGTKMSQHGTRGRWMVTV